MKTSSASYHYMLRYAINWRFRSQPRRPRRRRTPLGCSIPAPMFQHRGQRTRPWCGQHRLLRSHQRGSPLVQRRHDGGGRITFNADAPVYTFTIGSARLSCFSTPASSTIQQRPDLQIPAPVFFQHGRQRHHQQQSPEIFRHRQRRQRRHRQQQLAEFPQHEHGRQRHHHQR